MPDDAKAADEALETLFNEPTPEATDEATPADETTEEAATDAGEGSEANTGGEEVAAEAVATPEPKAEAQPPQPVDVTPAAAPPPRTPSELDEIEKAIAEGEYDPATAKAMQVLVNRERQREAEAAEKARADAFWSGWKDRDVPAQQAQAIFHKHMAAAVKKFGGDLRAANLYATGQFDAEVAMVRQQKQHAPNKTVVPPKTPVTRAGAAPLATKGGTVSPKPKEMTPEEKASRIEGLELLT